MKKLLLTLMLICASVFSFTLKAQLTLTVADGTTTNEYVPVYGYYEDAYNLCQVIYPANLLSNMMGGTITSMTFYLSSSATLTSTFAVKLGTTTASSFTSAFQPSPSQTVYTGTFTINSSNQIVLTFTTPFVYAGGNLLLEVSTVSTTGDDYSNTYFYGTTSTASSIQNYNYDDLSYITSGTSHDFIPKTTFGYVPSSGNFCYPPTGLTVSNVTEYSADLSWTAGGTENEWELTINGVPQIVTSTTYSLTGLNPSTTYNVSVRSICGAGDTSFAVQTSFLTPQIPATLPYTQDWESETENSQWTIDNSGGINKWYIGGAVTGASGDSALYISSDNGLTHTYDITSTSNVWAYRDIDFGTGYGEYVLSFDFVGNGESCCDYMRMFIGAPAVPSGSSNPAGAVLLGTLNVVDSMTHYTAALNSSFAGVQRVYLLWHNDGSVGTPPPAALDNLHIEGHACGFPYGLALDTATTTTVDFHFSPAVATDNAWEAVIVAYGDTLDETQAISITDTFYQFTNLNHSSTYYIYVRTNCGSEYSSWSSGLLVRTECASISTLPYREGFETYATGSSNPIYCWTRNSTYNSSYPYVTTTPASGLHSLYFYNSSSTYCAISLPQLDQTILINTLQLSFKMRTSNVAGAKMIVGVMTDPTDMNTFTAVQTLSVSATNTYESFDVDFSGYTGTGSYIAFKSQFTGYYNAYVDDIYLNLIPTCQRPVNVEVTASTSSSATINWTPRNNETDWQLVVVPHGQPASAGMPEYPTTHPYTVSNLTDATNYDVYVKADCGGGDESDWSDVVTFRTKCLATSVIPYTEGFEGVGTGTNAYPICWTKKSTYTSSTCPYVNSSYHSAGAASLYFYMPSGYYMYAASQALDLSNYNAGDLALSFKLMPYSGLSYARMDVGVMTDPDDEATFSLLKSYYPGDFTATSVWHSFSIPLTQTYSSPIYIVFKTPVSSTTTYMYLDEVSVDLAPTCSAPSHFAVSNVSSTSALLTWNESEYGTPDYYVEYTEQGQNNWIPSSPITGTSYLLSGLDTNTQYQVRIYGDCNGETTATQTLSFTTMNILECLQSNTTSEVTSSTNTTAYYIPCNNFYNYTYSQQIFTPSEVSTTPTLISGIEFQYNYSTAMTQKTDVDIYLAHTTLNSFSSSSSWVPISSAQLVYSGSLNCSSGWNTFTFDNPFSYNGQDNLVVIVDDNSGHYNGNSYTFNTHGTGTNMSIYYYSDGTNPNPSAPPTGTLYAYRVDTKFHTCLQSTPQTCVAPNAYVSAYDDESIEVTWAPGFTESAWEFEYKAANATSWTSVPGASSPQVLSGLTSNTVYNIRLRSDCGSEYSDWFTLTAETECSPITVPYMQNFDGTSAGTGAMVPCWTRATNYSTAYPYLYATQHESSPNSVYFYATSAYYSYIASPRFDDAVAMDSLLIRFKAKKTATSPYFIEVGIMTDPNDYNTFTLVGSFAPTSTTAFENGEVKTNGYAGTGKYVAFRCPPWISNTIYLDDVNIDYIPNCMHVSNVHALPTTITPYAADVVWTAGGDETEWDVVYGPAGSIADPSQLTPQTIYTTPSISLANLNANTLYEVFVQGHCDNGENSSWESGSFRTGCAAITVLPFMENFESYPTGSSSNHVLPNCWDYVNGGSSAAGCPTINTGSSYATGNCLYFYSYSSTSYTDQIAILPEIDVTTLPINTLRLYFDARKYQTSTSYVDYVEIGVMEANSQFVPVDTVTFTSTTISTHVVDFSNYTGTGTRMAIRAPRPTGSFTYNYTYLDNIRIDVAPSCANPTNFHVTNLTSTSADFTWTDAASEGTWQILVVPAAQIPDFTQAQTETNNTYSVSSLTANTQYKAYLRTVCSNGLGYSEWITTTFSTPCQPLATLPFSENFDSYAGTTSTSASVNNLPSCWAYHNNGTSTSYSGYPIVYNSSTYASSGSNSMRFYIYSTSGTYDDQVAILPPIDVTTYPLNTLMISFDARVSATSYAFNLEVGVMSNPADMSTFVPVQTIQTSSTTYAHYDVSFAQYTGTGNFIALKAARPTSGYNYGYVDNIVVDVVPDCSPVTDLTVSQIAGTSALLSWNDGLFGTPASYQVEYAEHGTNNWIPATGSVTSSPFLLGGLDPVTDYDVRVKTTCSDNSESAWAVEQFTTRCLAGGDVQVGNGTTTSYTLPVNNYYHYTYSQQIYLASELNGPSTFRSVSFEYGYSSATTKKTNVVIYLGHTTKSAFTSTSDYVALSDLTQVYSGSLNCQQGWNTFNFTTPFQYNGTDNLVLVVDDNSDQYDGSSYVFKLHSTGGNYRSLYFYSDSYNPDPSNPTSAGATGSYTTGNRSNVKFGGNCDSSATCIAPNMYVSNTTNNTATIEWVPGYTEGLWNMEYREAGDTLWTSATDQTSSPATLANLNSGTIYNVRMRSDCGGGDVSEWVLAEFMTECDAYPIPFVENFDNVAATTSTTVSVNNLPICWNYINTGTNTSYSGYPIVYNNSSSASSTPNSMRFYAGTGTYGSQMAILPNLDVTQNAMNTLQISFEARAMNVSYPFKLVVGVMTNPTNMNTFVPVDTITTQVTAYTIYDVLLNQYTGSGTYIAILAPQPASGYNYGYVDNIRVETIPTCSRPRDLTVTSVAVNSISLSWTEMGQASDWIVEYGPAGFTQGTGTTTQVQYTPTATITGLQPNTKYDFYVKADCGGGDQSYWSTKASGKTACLATTLPYSENFDNLGSGSGVLPPCWSGMNNYSTTLYPYISTSYHASGNASLYFYCSTSTYNIAVLPYVDVTVNPINTLQLSFEMYSTSSTTSTITVGVMTNPLDANTFTPITTVNNTATGVFQYKEVNLSSYSGQGEYVALKLTNTSSTYSVYIDDILLETIPTCPRPQNPTITGTSSSSVTLSWTAGGTETSWNVEYGPAGFSQGSGTVVPAPTNPFTVNNLTSGTVYDFYVQADCGSGDVSSWRGPVSAAPGSYNMSSTGYDTLHTCSSVIYDDGGPNGDYSNNASSVLTVYPGSTGGLVSVSGTVDVEDGYDYLVIYDGADTYGNVLFDSDNGYTTITNLTSTTGPITISFESDGSVQYSGFVLTVTCVGGGPAPTCDAPTGLAVGNLAPTTATATWNAGGTETAWDLQYKQHSASSWGNTIPLTAHTYNFTGLTAGTQYDVRVRANCGSNNYSDWTTAVTFTTLNQGQDPCNDPTNLTATNVTSNSVVLDWTENGTATSWTVNYKEANAANWSTTTASSKPYTLIGLQPETAYSAYVVANCTSGQSGATNTVTFTTESTGIADYELATTLYPNPTAGQFTIHNSQFTIHNVNVYDVYGKLLKTVEVNSNTAVIDAHELSAGMYFVRISTEKGVVTKSFVKK